MYDLLDSGDDDKLMELVEAETVMHFKSSEFDEKFIKDLKWDLTKLKYLSDMWKNIQTDPKLDQFKYELQHNKKLIGNKKIIFTESKETAEYLAENLTDLYGSRVIAYTGSSSLILKSVIEDSFNPKILILAIALYRGDTVERARSMQRNFVKKLLEWGNATAALVAFYTPDSPERWRFSYIRMDYTFSLNSFLKFPCEGES